jgi:hypothetical protein
MVVAVMAVVASARYRRSKSSWRTVHRTSQTCCTLQIERSKKEEKRTRRKQREMRQRTADMASEKTSAIRGQSLPGSKRICVSK